MNKFIIAISVACLLNLIQSAINCHQIYKLRQDAIDIAVFCEHPEEN